MSTTAENLPVVTPTAPARPAHDMSAFAQAQREAKALTTSSLVPAAYKGQENIGNALIAMEIAKRIGASTLLVMQNLHIIQGKPSWSSTFLIACVNSCGRFLPLRFEIEGSDPAKDDYRVRAYAEDKATRERCVGPWVAWPMVKAEGWLGKTGSKWKTMPELMFMYRAAGFWSRLFAPEVAMGILTREEVEDVWQNTPPTAPTDHGNIKTLEAELAGVSEPTGNEPPPPDIGPYPAPLPVKDIRRRLQLAETVDEVRACDALIAAVPDDDERDDLRVLQDQRLNAVQ